MIPGNCVGIARKVRFARWLQRALRETRFPRRAAERLATGIRVVGGGVRQSCVVWWLLGQRDLLCGLQACSLPVLAFTPGGNYLILSCVGMTVGSEAIVLLMSFSM